MAKAKRKTRKKANITLSSAIAPLASLGITEVAPEGGLVVDLGVEEGTILEEGIVGGTMLPMLPRHKPLLHIQNPLLVQSPQPPLDISNDGEVITREYAINLHTTKVSR